MKYRLKRKGLIALSIAILMSLLKSEPGYAQSVIIPGARPFSVFIPSSYNSNSPAPLLIALHGFNQSGSLLEKYLKIQPVAESFGLLYVHPDGTSDKTGTKFWNATPECCDFQKPKVDDDSYIMSIIDAVSQRYAVDPNRIYVVGHSNGGFMANELACNHSDRIAAIVNVAGGSFGKSSLCKPSSAISVLQIWGTADETYVGNHIMGVAIPGAMKTFTNWGEINRCNGSPQLSFEKKDLDRGIKGLDITIFAFSQCPSNTAVEFWKISGAGHVPKISPTFTRNFISFLLAHPKVA